MLKEIKDGLDTHADNAIRFFGAGKYQKDSKEFKALRQVAKIFTFRLLYGGGANGFFRDGSMPRFSLKKWQDIVEAYYKKYQGLQKWQQANVTKVYEQGYLRNPSGRILRFVPCLKRRVMQYDEADIYNYPVQSASSDVMYLAMAVLRSRFKELGLKSQFVLQVHDSMVIDSFVEEVDTICELAVRTFRELPDLCRRYWNWNMDVPLDGDCEVGTTYGDTVGYVLTKDATKCTVTYEEDDKYIHVDIPVTSYVDLYKDTTYIDMITTNKKVVKIKFTKEPN